MNKNKKLLICSILLCLFSTLFIISYSFYEFEDSTDSLIITSGYVDMYLNSSNEVNIQNSFPEDFDTAIIRTDNYIDFEVSGINTYTEKDIYYEIKLDYGEEISSKTRIDDEYLRFSLEDRSTNSFIFINESFDTINDKIIYINRIEKNNNLEQTHSYRLRVWISNEIKIGNKNQDYTFEEWNNIYASVKVSVYGDLIKKEDIDYYLPLYYEIRSKAVSDNIISTYVSSKIKYNSAPSDSNGKGVYELRTSANDTFPVYYYRGFVDDNNVIFANKCWRILRTTSTGGVKLMYNGTPTVLEGINPIDESDYLNVVNNSTYNFVYDDDTKMWSSTNVRKTGTTSEISFTLNTTGTYYLDYNLEPANVSSDKLYIYLNGSAISTINGLKDGQVSINVTSTSDVIKVSYVKSSSNTIPNNKDSVSFNIGFSNNNPYNVCNSFGNSTITSTESYRTLVGTSMLSDAGYYYGQTFLEEKLSSIAQNYVFSNDVTWDGTKYILDNSVTTLSTTISETKTNIKNNKTHYTCLSTSTECTEVSYVFYYDSSQMYYFNLTDGLKVEDAVKLMITESANTTPSSIASYLNSWFQSNLDGYVDSLEDTVFCDDRTITDLAGWSKDGDISKTLAFKNKNAPSSIDLSCPINDSFTVSDKNGNGALTYPIGLIQKDEVYLSGEASSNLSTGTSILILTPESFTHTVSTVRPSSTGSLMMSYDFAMGAGVKPVISLKKDTRYTGEGTQRNPYVIPVL